MGAIFPGSGWNFPPSFFVGLGWDGIFFVGWERFENPLPCHPLDWSKPIKTALTSNHCSWLKYEFSLSIILYSPVTRLKICNHRLISENKYVGEFWCERTTGVDLFTGGSVIMHYGLIFLSRSENLKLKCLDGFVSYKHASFCFPRHYIYGQESYGLLADYCDIFSSRLNSHSDGTHSLQTIHW